MGVEGGVVDGGGVCSLGRRNWSWSSDLCWLLLCKSLLWILGLGNLIQPQGYSVNGVYNPLVHDDQAQLPFTEILWNKTVSLKVSLFVWRLLNRRLPTKDNSTMQGVFHPRSLCSVVVGWMNRRIIYSWIVIFIGRFGLPFFRWLILACMLSSLVATIFSESMFVFVFKLFG